MMKTRILYGLLLTFLSFSVFAQTPIFSPGMTITGFNSVNSPGAEPVTNAIDGTNNKFLDFDEFDGMGFTVDLGGLSRTATSIEITTANDAPGRDPQTYEVFGSNNGVTFTSIATGAIPCIATRLFARTFTFANATAYTYYRVNFGTRCGTDSEMQVAEVQLYEPAVNMSYVSSTASQPNTAAVGVGSTNQEIIRIEVVTSGSLNPLDATQIRVRTNGTTDVSGDISNAKLWYTGTSSTFATTTQFGATVATPPLPGTNMIFNGTQALSSGTNYFWLTYDIQGGATIGNVVDALLQRITVDGSNYTPTTSAPAGNRIIAATCTHIARLTDTFGDGWNGGAVTISVNGVPVHTNITLAAGFGPQDFTFQAATGDVINITESAAGSFPTEMRVEILDGTPSSIWGASDPVATPGNNVNGNCPIPPDDPCTADVITVGCSGVKKSGNNSGMTNSGIANPSCASYAGGDVWYSFIVPASGSVKVEVYEGTLSDVGMSIYSVIGTCSSTFTELVCDDNSGFGNMSKITLTGQTPGNRLYVRVWDKNNNQTGTFEIDASDLSTNYCVTGNGIDQGNGCAQLTAASNGQLGSIWDADDKLDFTSDWSYDFTVNLGNSDAGADGIAFVIQNDPSALTTTGISGNQLGAGGITNSLIIEIDTYLNFEDRNDGINGVLCSGGPEPDHMDLWLNGDVNPDGFGCPGPAGTRYIPNGVELTNGGSSYNIENGLDHTLRVSYVAATQTITATTMNAAATVTYGLVSYSPVDPMTLFGTNAPYFGFTGSTGGLNNQQSACLAPSLVLPVEFLSFTVNCIEGNVVLNWTTATEINNDYFTIERSIDGINFEELGTVNGSGNSNAQLNYSWVDNNSLNTVAYYRIKQTDFNGEFSYYEIMAAECETEKGINIYPNPANSMFSFNYNSAMNEDLTIKIHNVAGQLLLEKNYKNLSNRESKTSVDIDALNNGVYFVTFSFSNKKVIEKITVIK